jgi:hypothetical protein
MASFAQAHVSWNLGQFADFRDRGVEGLGGRFQPMTSREYLCCYANVASSASAKTRETSATPISQAV